MNAIIDLEAEYRLTRAALVNAGLDMTNSIDALYRDWRRWRDKSKSLAAVDRVGVADPDQWWARHLAQFRSLIERRVNNDSVFRFSIQKIERGLKNAPASAVPYDTEDYDKAGGIIGSRSSTCELTRNAVGDPGSHHRPPICGAGEAAAELRLL